MGARLRLYESSSFKLTWPPGPTSRSALICSHRFQTLSQRSLYSAPRDRHRLHFKERCYTTECSCAMRSTPPSR